MADLTFPKLQEIISRMLTDAQTLLPESNPYLPNSFFQALLISVAGRNYENNQQLESMIKLLFIGTTSDGFLVNWGAVYNLTRKSSASASGNVTVEGSVGGLIPNGSILTSQSGIQYKTLSNASIQETTLNVTLSRTGSVVTATTASTHPYATGTVVTMSDATYVDYNGSPTITVLDNLNFTYTITTEPPVSASAVSQAFVASIGVESTEFTSAANLDSGGVLTFQDSFPVIDDNNAKVQYGGLVGGQDDESSDDYRARLLLRVQNPPANFSTSQIEQQAKLIDGVTRVRVLGTAPAVGFVTVYFVRDDDMNIIPTPTEVLEVKDKLLEILPAPMLKENLIVSAPTPVLVDFQFAAVSPDIDSLKTAIAANLTQFFKDNSEIGKFITEVAYNSAIYNTIDPVTGAQVESFTLTSPTGDVAINEGEIGVLNNVQF